MTLDLILFLVGSVCSFLKCSFCMVYLPHILFIWRTEQFNTLHLKAL